MRRTIGPDHIQNLFGAGKHGFGDEQPGIRPATVVDAAVLNTWQEELARAIEGEGFALNPADNSQLSQAMHAAARQEIDSTEQLDGNLVAGLSIERSAVANLHEAQGANNFITLCICSATFGGIERFYAGGSQASISAVCRDFGSHIPMPGATATSFLYGAAFNGTLLAVVGGGAARSSIYTTGTGTTYDVRLDTASGGRLYSVCVHQGQFVAVGSLGQVYRSPGTTWTPSTSAPGIYLLSVASNGGRLVAVGHNGGTPLLPVIYTSDNDGVTWQPRSFPTGPSTTGLTSVVWSGQRWIAAGFAGELLVSADGTTWERATGPYGAGTFSGLFRGLGTVGDYTVLAVGDGGEVRSGNMFGTGWTPVTKLTRKVADGSDGSTSAVTLNAVGSSPRLRRAYLAGQNAVTISQYFFTNSW